MDKNMSRLNPLVTDCRVKLAVWLAEDTDISLTQTLCYRVNHPDFFRHFEAVQD